MKGDDDQGKSHEVLASHRVDPTSPMLDALHGFATGRDLRDRRSPPDNCHHRPGHVQAQTYHHRDFHILPLYVSYPDHSSPQRSTMTSIFLIRPPIVDDQLLDEVVAELNRIHRSTTVDLALAIGKLIIDRFYAGELAVWRKHAGKEVSFRKLAARAGRDLHVTATTLYRAVALYELTQRLGISRWKHLSVSHLRAVLGLREDEQRQLLAAADLARWTTAHLEAEARKLRCARLGNRGRRPLPGFMKTSNRLATLLANGEAVSVDPEALRRLDDFERQRLATALSDVQAAITSLQLQVESYLRCA